MTNSFPVEITVTLRGRAAMGETPAAVEAWVLKRLVQNDAATLYPRVDVAMYRIDVKDVSPNVEIVDHTKP